MIFEDLTTVICCYIFLIFRFDIGVCIRQIGSSLERNAVKVFEEDNKDIIVYGINRERFTTEGFLALPDTATGRWLITKLTYIVLLNYLFQWVAPQGQHR